MIAPLLFKGSFGRKIAALGEAITV